MSAQADDSVEKERSAPPPGGRRWPDYRTVWRWHFYAGVFCIPFVIFLAITGSIYLFKPQIEALIDRPYDHLAAGGTAASPSRQIAAAVAAYPGASFGAYELPPSRDAAGRVLIDRGGQIIRVYVHPETLAVVHAVPENSRLMKVIFRLHGELLMGNRGSFVVELAASWAIIMIASGLFLWWPRNARGLGGIVYPRLRSGSRLFWRDLHSVIGVWVSALALFMLLTGLPWAKFWGDYYKTVRRIAGTASLRQGWANGSTKVAGMGDGELAGAGGGDGHGGGRGMRGGNLVAVLPSIDKVVEVVEPLRLDAPVLITTAGGTRWNVKSMAANRPRQVEMVVDGETGDVLSKTGFGQRALADRIIGTGIAAHEGQLFGWPNQLLGLATAMGLIVLCISAVVLWWKRREPGTLGAPAKMRSPRLAVAFFGVLALLGIYLPMFGISAILVVCLEKAVLRRIPAARDWLGISSV